MVRRKKNLHTETETSDQFSEFEKKEPKIRDRHHNNSSEIKEDE
jgi:hypothetical protein